MNVLKIYISLSCSPSNILASASKPPNITNTNAENTPKMEIISVLKFVILFSNLFVFFSNHSFDY